MNLHNRSKFLRQCLVAAITCAASITALAGPVYMPPSANLVYGDVTHGQRILSASGNPAAAAVDVVRGGGKSVSGTVISGGAGLEYGNVQDLFDTIDELAKAFKPSNPGTGGTPPGQKPGDKPLDTMLLAIETCHQHWPGKQQKERSEVGKAELRYTPYASQVLQRVRSNDEIDDQRPPDKQCGGQESRGLHCATGTGENHGARRSIESVGTLTK